MKKTGVLLVVAMTLVCGVCFGNDPNIIKTEVKPILFLGQQDSKTAQSEIVLTDIPSEIMIADISSEIGLGSITADLKTIEDKPVIRKKPVKPVEKDKPVLCKEPVEATLKNPIVTSVVGNRITIELYSNIPDVLALANRPVFIQKISTEVLPLIPQWIGQEIMIQVMKRGGLSSLYEIEAAFKGLLAADGEEKVKQ